MASNAVINPKFILLDQTLTSHRKLKDFSVYFKWTDFPGTILPVLSAQI